VDTLPGSPDLWAKSILHVDLSLGSNSIGFNDEN
jgi:hypothetical protein